MDILKALKMAMLLYISARNFYYLSHVRGLFVTHFKTLYSILKRLTYILEITKSPIDLVHTLKNITTYKDAYS